MSIFQVAEEMKHYHRRHRHHGKHCAQQLCDKYNFIT